jgi:hypothetical protein
VVDVPDREARRLLATRQAEEVVESATETIDAEAADADPATNKATIRPASASATTRRGK